MSYIYICFAFPRYKQYKLREIITQERSDILKPNYGKNKTRRNKSPMGHNAHLTKVSYLSF